MDNNYSREELLEMARMYLAPNYAPFNVMVDKATGCWIRDVDGRWFLDMLSTYSAANMGNVNQRILNALFEQAHKVAILPGGAVHSVEKTLFAKELVEFCGMEMVIFMNSGAEAVETVLKLARKWASTKRKPTIDRDKDEAEIIVLANNFHGRTITIVSFSTEPQYRNLFGPHTPGFRTVPYGDAKAFKEAITSRTAAFLVEPIQGEGGIVVPPNGYLKECYRICRENNILFIADEIQTGLARTGKMFACDHEGVKPDLYLLAKSLSGAFVPISAVVGSRELLTTFEPGDHGSTFGGNPLACHVGRESLRVIVEENLVERSAELGSYFMDKLRATNSPHVEEIRGKGLLIGVVLKEDSPTAHEFCERLVNEGIICKEARERVIRLSPPLNITMSELDWGLDRIKRVLS